MSWFESLLRNNEVKESEVNIADISRAEIKMLVSKCVSEEEALKVLLRRGKYKTVEWGWSTILGEESLKRRLSEGNLESQPVCDIALAVAFWCDKYMRDEDEVYEYEYVLRGLADLMCGARRKKLYDDNNTEDILAIQTVFKTFIRNLPNARSENFSQEFASDVFRGIGRGRGSELRSFAVELISEFASSEILGERREAWEGAGNCLNTHQVCEILCRKWENPSRIDTLFAAEPLAALNEILDRENKLYGFSRSGKYGNLTENDVFDLQGAFATLENSLPIWKAHQHETNLYSAINTYLGNSEVMQALLPKELSGNVAQYVHDELVSKRLKAMVVTPKLSVSELNRIDWGAFQYFDEVFEFMSKEDQEELLEYLNKRVSEDDGDILREVFGSIESNNIDKNTILTPRKAIRSEVHDCFKEPALMKVVSTMFDHREEFLFQLGVILTMIPYKEFPEDVRVKIRAYLDDTEQKIRPFHDEWYLCGASESLLIQSLTLGAVVMVNDSFVVKFVGKRTALCIRSFTDKVGKTFVEGNWYSPVGTEFVDQIKRANKSGRTRLNVKRGDWAIMRSLQGSYEVTAQQYLAEAKILATSIEQRSGRVLGKSREDFATKCFEDN